MSEKKHEPTQLVLDTKLAINIGIGIFLFGIAAGSDSPLKLADIASWFNGNPGQLALSAETTNRFTDLEGDIRDLRLIYGQLQDDHITSGKRGAEAWRSDARHEARQDVKIEGLDEKVGTLSKEL